MLARCPRSAETNIDQDITNLKEKWESVKSKLNEKKVSALISMTELRLPVSGLGLGYSSSYQESSGVFGFLIFFFLDFWFFFFFLHYICVS